MMGRLSGRFTDYFADEGLPEVDDPEDEEVSFIADSLDLDGAAFGGQEVSEATSAQRTRRNTLRVSTAPGTNLPDEAVLVKYAGEYPPDGDLWGTQRFLDLMLYGEGQMDPWSSQEGKGVSMFLVGDPEDYEYISCGANSNQISLKPRGDSASRYPRLDTAEYPPEVFRVQSGYRRAGRRAVLKDPAYAMPLSEMHKYPALWELVREGTRLPVQDWGRILDECRRTDASRGGDTSALEVVAAEVVAARSPRAAGGVNILSPQADEAGAPRDAEDEREALLDSLRQVIADVRGLERGVGLVEGQSPLGELTAILNSAVEGVVVALSFFAGVPAGDDTIPGIRARLAKIDDSARQADLDLLATDVQTALSTARTAAQRARGSATPGVADQTFKAAMTRVSTSFNRLKNALRDTCTAHDSLVRRVDSLAQANTGGPHGSPSTVLARVAALDSRLGQVESVARDGPPLEIGGMRMGSAADVLTWEQSGGLPVNRVVAHNFTDMCSLFAYLGSDTVSTEEIERREIHGTRTMRSPRVNAYGASFSAPFPQIISRGGDADGYRPNPFRAASFEEWDRLDGFSGLANVLKTKLMAGRLELTTQIQNDLLGFPQALNVAMAMLNRSLICAEALLARVNSLYTTLLVRICGGRTPTKSQKAVLWQLCVDLLKTFFLKLHEKRVSGRDAHTRPPHEANSTLIHATFQAHKVMEEFRDAQFTGHFDFQNTYNEYIVVNSAQKVDVDTVRETAAAQEARIKDLEREVEALKKIVGRLTNGAFNDGGGGGGTGGARKGKKKGKEADEE